MLELSSIHLTYPGPVEALRSVNLALRPGVFGLLGPNGAGKSTLMRILATLQRPDSGDVRLGDIDLLANPHEARRKIGYLPQDLGVYPRVTAREMLEYLAGLKGIGPRRVRRDLAKTQLERVNLLDVADRRLDTFSGGMRQRFGIAAAFLGKPDLVIVDEPTAGLDPAERRRFQCMLSEAAEDCVLILSSHIVEDIAGLCQQMAIMDRGQIVLTGDPQALVAELDGKVWEVQDELQHLEAWRQRDDTLAWRPNRGRLVVRLHSDTVPEVGALKAERVQPDLEDLFAFHVESHG